MLVRVSSYSLAGLSDSCILDTMCIVCAPLLPWMKHPDAHMHDCGWEAYSALTYSPNARQNTAQKATIRHLDF